MPGVIEEAMKVMKFSRHKVDDGWKYLGCGSYRHAYLSPTGVVYKRMKYGGYDDDMNRNEFKNIQKYKSIKITGWDVPDASLFAVESEDIIAMEFIEGVDDNDCERYAEIQDCSCKNEDGRCVFEIW